MQTIVINSQKGGSGKTSVCAHLSVEAERVGDGPVYLIDTDPQGTLTAWHEARLAETPRRVEIGLSELPDALNTLAQRGATFCFIDTTPNRGDENAELFRMADIVLVPVRPSPSDLWAVSATVALLKREGKPFLFVVNQATLNANITAQAIASLSHHGPVAETIIGTRVHYAAAMTDGHTAPELAARGPAAQETASLWINIKACLHASMPATKAKAHAETGTAQSIPGRHAASGTASRDRRSRLSQTR
jgi:chromosome partitioning protein